MQLESILAADNHVRPAVLEPWSPPSRYGTTETQQNTFWVTNPLATRVQLSGPRALFITSLRHYSCCGILPRYQGIVPMISSMAFVCWLRGFIPVTSAPVPHFLSSVGVQTSIVRSRLKPRPDEADMRNVPQRLDIKQLSPLLQQVFTWTIFTSCHHDLTRQSTPLRTFPYHLLGFQELNGMLRNGWRTRPSLAISNTCNHRQRELTNKPFASISVDTYVITRRGRQ